jgi:isocitrate lyase
VFLIHRYKAAAIHYLTPTEDNHRQGESMQRLGIFENTYDEVGEIIVADVNRDVVRTLVAPASEARERLIARA